MDEERNGLVFTCRGGFIDTAHVRDDADWTIYFGSRFFEKLASGTAIDPTDEAGKRRFVLERIDPTQDDFPAIVAAIREQSRREFGSRADQPD